MSGGYSGTSIPNGSIGILKLAGGSFVGNKIIITPVVPYTVIQGTFTVTHNGVTFLPQELVTGPSNANDEVNWPVSLLAGTYTIIMDFVKSLSSGKGRFYLDSTALDTGVFDMYAAGGAAAQYILTGIVVGSNSNSILKLKVPSKNVASAGYDLRISQITITKTA